MHGLWDAGTNTYKVEVVENSMLRTLEDSSRPCSFFSLSMGFDDVYLMYRVGLVQVFVCCGDGKADGVRRSQN
jgi:hypothetical protein